MFEEEDYRQQFKLGAWRRIFSLAMPYRKYFAAMFALMCVVAGVDAMNPFVTGWIVDHVIVAKDTKPLLMFPFVYAAIILVQMVGVKLFIRVSGRIEMGINYEIRKAGFRKLQELSFSYYDRTSEGWLMARMTSDTGKLADIMAWGVQDMTWGILMMTAMAILMISSNWRLALITLSVVPVLAVVSLLFQRTILDRYRVVRKTNSRITASFSEGIRGALAAKTLVCERGMSGEFERKTNFMRLSSVRAAVMAALYMPIVVTLSYVGSALALWKGGGDVISGTLTYGSLVAFVFSSIQFFEPVMNLSRVLSDFQYAQASAERVVSLLDTEPEVRDSAEVIEASGDRKGVAYLRSQPLSGRVSFRNVSFAYRQGQKVLSDFSLEVEPGESIALVGETGSGKSTIVNLACRFYEPTEGRVLIDGTDYRQKSLRWLHAHLGYVLQTPYLFAGTVAENIRYGNLDASDDEIREAARIVNADEFITRLEKGYGTEVGEGGSLLSTGEKQLVSFARAVLADPRIFVLDEATSSVDTETELKIQEAITRVLEGRTSFIVAHRLSTIAKADRIVVVEQGVIEEIGTHRELMSRRGRYFRLYTNQFMEERRAALLRGSGEGLSEVASS